MGREASQSLAAWKGWHAIAPPIRPLFQKYVELGNKGARELKFRDTGAMWRSKYDMPADAFAAEYKLRDLKRAASSEPPVASPAL